jgi:hypothetical protein
MNNSIVDQVLDKDLHSKPDELLNPVITLAIQQIRELKAIRLLLEAKNDLEKIVEKNSEKAGGKSGQRTGRNPQ